MNTTAKKYYLVSVLNTTSNTDMEIAELLTPDCITHASDYEWKFCDVKEVQVGDQVEPFFNN